MAAVDVVPTFSLLPILNLLGIPETAQEATGGAGLFPPSAMYRPPPRRSCLGTVEACCVGGAVVAATETEVSLLRTGGGNDASCGSDSCSGCGASCHGGGRGVVTTRDDGSTALAAATNRCCRCAALGFVATLRLVALASGDEYEYDDNGEDDDEEAR